MHLVLCFLDVKPRPLVHFGAWFCFVSFRCFQLAGGVTLEHRIKEPYSMWKKMERQGGGVDSVYDAVALRVVIKAKREAGETDEAHEEKSRQLCYHVRSQEATCRPCCIPGMTLQDVHSYVPGINVDGILLISIPTLPQYKESLYAYF